MMNAYLLAHPAGHSLSPRMHNAAFRHLGLKANYKALDIPPDDLAATLASLREKTSYGANVTIPYKQAVMPLLDHCSDEARRIGAVNTILNRNGQLLGYNTDADGFLQALTLEAGYAPKDKKVGILGAGGAARAIVYALLKSDVDHIYIYNRTREKARILVEDFADLGSIKDLDYKAFTARLKEVDLLINTTSVGMEHDGIDPDTSPLPSVSLPLQGMVCDIIYRPSKTRLLKDALAAGLSVQNGLPMLAYQGARSFEIWTGEKAPVQIMMQVLNEA